MRKGTLEMLVIIIIIIIISSTGGEGVDAGGAGADEAAVLQAAAGPHVHLPGPRQGADYTVCGCRSGKWCAEVLGSPPPQAI